MSGDIPLLPVYAFMAWAGQQVRSKDDGVTVPLKTRLKTENILKKHHLLLVIIMDIQYELNICMLLKWNVATGWTVRDRIPVGTRFSARPHRSWCPPSLL